jgi:hypothetical protein
MRTFIFLLLSLSALGCTYEVDQLSACEVSQDSIQYFAHVYPIVDRTCAIPACHVNGFEHGNFTDAEELKKAAASGKLEFMINTRQMPPATTAGKPIISDCEILIIRAWIKNGIIIE